MAETLNIYVMKFYAPEHLPLDGIKVTHFNAPPLEKYRYYRDYYLRTKKLASPVVVDEDGTLVDGHISYMLAREYHISEVMGLQINKVEPYFKTILGKKVELDDTGKWQHSNSDHSEWIYSLSHPVVPGDIILVNTQNGTQKVIVEEISGIAGKDCGSGKKRVREFISSIFFREDAD